MSFSQAHFRTERDIENFLLLLGLTARCKHHWKNHRTYHSTNSNGLMWFAVIWSESTKKLGQWLGPLPCLGVLRIEPSHDLLLIITFPNATALEAWMVDDSNWEGVRSYRCWHSGRQLGKRGYDLEFGWPGWGTLALLVQNHMNKNLIGVLLCLLQTSGFVSTKKTICFLHSSCMQITHRTTWNSKWSVQYVSFEWSKSTLLISAVIILSSAWKPSGHWML